MELIAITTPDGVTFETEGYPMRFVKTPASNWGLHNVDYNTYRPYKSDIETIIDYRLPKRTFSLSYEVLTRNDLDLYWQARREILDYIRPNRVSMDSDFSLILTVQLPDHTVYNIYCVVDSMPFDAPPDGLKERNIFEQIKLIAYDPLWYSDEIEHEVTQNIDAELQMPHDMPHLLGENNQFGVAAINYLGTWKSQPLLVATGPFTSIEFRHEQSGRAIQLIYSALAGETVTIDCKRRIAYNDSNDALTGYLSSIDDITDFYLHPAPYMPGGLNNIQVVAPGFALPDTTIKIAYRNGYESI